MVMGGSHAVLGLGEGLLTLLGTRLLSEIDVEREIILSTVTSA